MTAKTRIEVALLLPAVPGARDACVQRLGDLLKAKHEAMHLAGDSDKRSAQLCIYYDPDRLSTSEVRDSARKAGVELDQRFGHFLLKLEPMFHSCLLDWGRTS